jgi:hypothetical protein
MNETFTALSDYRRRVKAMLDDPECTGDLLALGVALLDFAVLRTSDSRSWADYAERAWGDKNGWRVRHVLQSDIRRYDAIKDAGEGDPARKCGAPMIRRQGSCGQSATRRTLLTDPESGRRQWLGACKRHLPWFEQRLHANRMAVSEYEAVVAPPANAGGVLARHIPEIDWEATWKKLDPEWTRPPEAEPQEVSLKPRLRLVLGGAS